MHAHEHVVALADVAADQREVRLLVDHAFEAVDAERAVLGRKVGFRDFRHQAFGPHPVADQIGDRDHQQLVPLRELRERRHARHGAVVVHDFADHAGRRQARDAREIDRGLGLAGAHQHAAVARAQREDVAGPREIGRLGLRD